MHHPWKAFAKLREWTLHWSELPEGILGHTVHTMREVFLTHGMLQVERRCTIEHERWHILLGPAPAGMEDEWERRVRKNAAQTLLPEVRAIADALVWARCDLEEAAEELWVDAATLRDRLEFMAHPAERAYLRRRLTDAAEWEPC